MLTYTAPACPQDPNDEDLYTLTADFAVVQVRFRVLCGRAVVLDFAEGDLPAGSAVCLDRISGGCVAKANPGFCDYTHLHAASIGITIDGTMGPFPDPQTTVGEHCGFGQVVPASCPADSVPGLG
ncbi:MAG TPA: hypothetical protein VFD84_00610 [Candidatus Binatia bacterium]|nr:hypothetical protein [Candidatus Binatia bacterium]